MFDGCTERLRVIEHDPAERIEFAIRSYDAARERRKTVHRDPQSSTEDLKRASASEATREREFGIQLENVRLLLFSLQQRGIPAFVNTEKEGK